MKQLFKRFTRFLMFPQPHQRFKWFIMSKLAALGCFFGAILHFINHDFWLATAGLIIGIFNVLCAIVSWTIHVEWRNEIKWNTIKDIDDWAKNDWEEHLKDCEGDNG